MYQYLDENGLLYVIEILEDGRFFPIGDVTVKQQNLPITIGVAQYRGRGFGKRVMKVVLQRAKELGHGKISDSVV